MKIGANQSHKFSEVPHANIPRSSFDRSHGLKTTFNAGYLVPIFIDEALPGDTFNLQLTAFARMTTPLFPVMDNIYMNTFFFAVPIRLVWDNFEKFNGAQEDPTSSTDFLIPQMTAPASVGHLNGSLSDYMGLPTEVPDYTHSTLWHRAYNLIYNEWFRDQNLQDSVVVDKDDGPDSSTDYVLLRRGKRHDYFTSALPWPQKGDSVDIPIGTKAPVYGIGQSSQTYATNISTIYEAGGPPTTAYPNSRKADVNTYIQEDPDISGYPNIYADLTQATAATINQLREAFQVQKLYERDARGGTRYTEVIRSHFGVTSPDARLQRPEYLGGGQTNVNISQVPQTSESNITAQGTLTGFGEALIRNQGFVKSFTEHCLLIGLVSVRADLTYQQGLNRMWSRLTRFDHYWPALAHIGEQDIKNKEIYIQNLPADELVFGYQERFAEYRYKPNQITGQFRSNFAQSLDGWHLSQDFGSLPVLNDSFIQDTPPMARVLAVADPYPNFLFDSYVSLRCARPMPVYGVPGMIDHF